MRIAIHQPNYLPWSVFFHKMAICDVFVLLDNVQYPRRDYCNRTQIKSPLGVYWLTHPVERGHFHQQIKEIRLSQPEESLKRHLETLHHFYNKAPCYQYLLSSLKPIYKKHWNFLLPLNITLIKAIADLLGITTPLLLASSLGDPPHGKSKRIVYICKKLGADTYLSGLGAKKYNDPEDFVAANINLDYHNFIPPIYAQGIDTFIPNLSIIDLIAYHGPESRAFLKI